MISYNEFNVLSPPRAEKSVPSTMLSVYENLNWWAQYKKNGTYNVIYVSPEKKVVAKTRHLDDHKAWGWSKETKEPFEALPGKGWYVLCAELLHSKVPGIRDVNYLHDVLVYDGEYLLGQTYAQRYQKLQGLFLKAATEKVQTDSHWQLSQNLWLARNHKKGFKKIFDAMIDPEDEGIVLKDPNAVLGSASNRWSVKCRRPMKNYSF